MVITAAHTHSPLIIRLLHTHLAHAAAIYFLLLLSCCTYARTLSLAEGERIELGACVQRWMDGWRRCTFLLQASSFLRGGGGSFLLRFLEKAGENEEGVARVYAAAADVAAVAESCPQGYELLCAAAVTCAAKRRFSGSSAAELLRCDVRFLLGLWFQSRSCFFLQLQLFLLFE